jgi:hypothetical protein
MRSEAAVQDVRALLEYLTASNAQYALAGGLAVGLWLNTCSPAIKKKF